MYDVIIIGGGLAGLINAIQLARAHFKVAVFEKNAYPFHRVCGEYISNETLPFLKSLDIDPFAWGAIRIERLRVSSPQGNHLDVPLDLGGFGLSRYTLDNQLYQMAQALEVDFYLKTQVQEIQAEPRGASLKTSLGESFKAKIIIGAYGKRANLDNYLKRSFFRKRSPYVGIKYHIYTDLHPEDQIALHNFKDGYCGISRVEEGKYCLCYLSSRENLKNAGSIEALEENILGQNPFLAQLFSQSEFIYDKAKVINEISFLPKPLIESPLLMCGDSAGMIAPLCGNGMAMAIHSAKILSELIIDHLQGHLSRRELEQKYQQSWQKIFATRLWIGRNVQYLFGHPLLTEILLGTAKRIRPLSSLLVKYSHGRAF